VATNPDFSDLLSELSTAGADFIVVGAHAVMFHAAPRFTKDLDVWVKPSADNAARVFAALAAHRSTISPSRTSAFLARCFRLASHRTASIS
jgi:hypothetical protein